jgi:hypothetical protein
MINLLDLITKACKGEYAPMIQEVFGDPGLDAAFRVIEAAKNLYIHVEPERIQGQVVIYQRISAMGIHSIPASPVSLAGLANQSIMDLILEVTADGTIYMSNLSNTTLNDLAQTAVVYWYKAGTEMFFAGSRSKAVDRHDPSARSQFCIPTLANLREALEHYAVENIRESTCYIFQRVWFEDNRLFLKAKPEADIRRSLTQFLRNRIGGDHDIFPEQNVNEKKPVDIRVTPKFNNNRMMLIEIKWIGDSVDAEGHITASHREARVQSGAEQLAGYLDSQKQFAPSHVIHGYYVIIDARRQHLKEGATTIGRAEGMYFEDKDIVLKPAYDQSRTDFDPPYRMFATPICSD